MLIGLALTTGLASDGRAQVEATPNQQLMKIDLLVVIAHPDDETMMGATIARYSDAGKSVALVACTRGEGGGNGTGKESGLALGVVREAELRKCLAILGVRHLYFLNQVDWAYTESVQATLTKWGHDESLRRLVRLVRSLRPDVICTMNPAPAGGQHGHHQAAGRLATEALDAAADASRFPELTRDEGLPPWAALKLYWTSFRGGTLEIATDGVAKGALAASPPGERYADIARLAARNHRSQGFDKFLTSPPTAGQRGPTRPDGFLLVKSRVVVDPRTEKDLFDGVGNANVNHRDTLHDLLASQPPTPPAAAPLVAQLRPRGNMLNYRDWLKANGISRLLSRMPAAATVVQGRADNRIEVEVTNSRTAGPEIGSVSLEMPAGWQLDPTKQSFTVAAQSSRVVVFRCAVPSNAMIKSYEMAVRLNSAKEVATLDVVPAVAVPHLTGRMPVDANATKWQNAKVAATMIPPSNGAAGDARASLECSARFFVAHDDAGLQLLVDVTDDTVALNIAPDDIKAHWRSTSVEICIDPTPPSENTFSTFKLGIFPQDTTGKVRAARDADANPGELGRIHSHIQLASRLTSTGYIVEAHIPWSEVGRPVRAGDAVGFNVILYHAGKKIARIGEDIGKSRRAWSSWPGVQGRPEVWGTAVMK